ncbi:L-carnitine dehydratase [Alicycliphilus sp. B1]|nr:L-carnitine dehydratase [Alicycliphilus sp. B1]
MGYDEVLRERFPRLIHCRVTGFGATGPLGGLPGYDAAVQALSGLMSINGDPDGRGHAHGCAHRGRDHGTQRRHRHPDGAARARAQRPGSSRWSRPLFDSALFSLYPHSINTLFTGRAPQRSGNGHPNIAPYDTYATATEPIYLAVGNNGQFQRLCEAVGHAHLAEDERYATKRPARRAPLRTQEGSAKRLQQLRRADAVPGSWWRWACPAV